MAHEEEFIPRRRERVSGIVSAMDDITPILPSQILARAAETKKPEIEEEEYYGNDEWMQSLAAMPKIRATRTIDGLTDPDMMGKKRKKKKKKKGKATDYEEKFSTELALLRDLLREQTSFVSAAQRTYNAMQSQKSSARGIGKYTTDLMAAINSGRSLAKDLVKEIIGTKKTIAELSMKEKEKLAKAMGLDSDDLTSWSASFLKTLTSKDRVALEQEIGGIEDLDSADDLFAAIDDGDSEETESQKYLKYERLKPEVRARYIQATGDTEFYAVSEDGDLIEDYPVPAPGTRLDVNTSTNIGTDEFGRKFYVDIV